MYDGGHSHAITTHPVGAPSPGWRADIEACRLHTSCIRRGAASGLLERALVPIARLPSAAAVGLQAGAGTKKPSTHVGCANTLIRTATKERDTLGDSISICWEDLRPLWNDARCWLRELSAKMNHACWLIAETRKNTCHSIDSLHAYV